MKLSALDLGIVLIYLLVTLIFGFWIAKKANTNIKSYFLGGNTIPWKKYSSKFSNTFKKISDEAENADDGKYGYNNM